MYAREDVVFRGGAVIVPLTRDELDSLRRNVGTSRQEMEHRLVGHLDGPTDQGHALWV